MRTRLFALALGYSVSFLTVGCGDSDKTTVPTEQGSGAADDPSEGRDASAGAIDAGRPRLDAGGGQTLVVATPGDAGTHADASTPKPDGAVAAVSDPPRLKPKCVKKPTQVMVIGDSYINWVTHTFPADMAKEANQTWRMEAIGAYSMGSGGIGLIGTQYDGSIMKDPDCHTILMDGGGNDMLVADPNIDPNRDCLTAKSTSLPQCQTIIDKAIAAADALLKKASAAGIRDVVYFFYPHVPEGTLLGGASPNTILDYALPQIRKFCDGVEAETSGKTRCTFVDMVPVFQGHDDWFFPGDIHETSMGSAAMAKQIWSVMKDKCIAQPASAGCCEE